MERDREVVRNAPLLKNSTYDVVKWAVTIFLPAFGALYFGIAQIWGLPAAEQVVGTVVTLEIFLGTLIGISSKQYNNSDIKYDGALVMNTEDPEKDVFSLEVDTPLLHIADKKDLTLKVVKP